MPYSNPKLIYQTQTTAATLTNVTVTVSNGVLAYAKIFAQQAGTGVGSSKAQFNASGSEFTIPSTGLELPVNTCAITTMTLRNPSGTTTTYEVLGGRVN